MRSFLLRANQSEGSAPGDTCETHRRSQMSDGRLFIEAWGYQYRCDSCASVFTWVFGLRPVVPAARGRTGYLRPASVR